MLSKGSVQTQPETGVVEQSQKLSSSTSGRWKWLIYASVGVAIVLAVKFFHVQDLLKSALDWIGKLGPWGPVIFVGIYIVATVFFIPGSVLTLGAGAVFGVGLGSVCVSISATLGATAAFLVGRYLARDAIARKIEKNEKFAAIDRAVADEGWKIVFLTRLSPVFPFTLLNYAFGLTRVSLVCFFLLSQTVGIVPPSITNSLPVMAEALSEARNATSSATSSGRLGRPRGMPPIMSISFCRDAV
jgi:uncharacterized membrane protein YdjX (TVP38/TMEM64 family)